MAVAKVTSNGWYQWDESTAIAITTTDGWYQVMTLDVNAAMSGSAITPGVGTQIPSFSIPL